MARLGAFDPTLRPQAWIDETGVVEGWFDKDLIGEASSSPDVIVSVTGVQADAFVGTITPSTVVSASGNQASSAIGTVAPAISATLTGIGATGQLGNVTTARTVPLTGIAATGSVGAVLPTISVSVSGNLSTAQVGTVTTGRTIGLSGNQVTGEVGNVSAVAEGTQQDTHDPGSYVPQYKRKEPWKDEKRAELRKQLQVALGFLKDDASRDQESKALVEEVTAQYAKADAVPQNTREFIIDYDAIMLNIEYVQRIIDLYLIRKKRHALAILLLLGV